MNVGDVQEYKLTAGEEELVFRLDFDALIKFNERYKDYKTVPEVDEAGKVVLDSDGNPKLIKLNSLHIFNDFLNGRNIYDAIVKILSCACISKDLTEEEFRSKLSFDFPTMKTLDLISNHIIQGSLTFTNENEGNSEKN